MSNEKKLREAAADLKRCSRNLTPKIQYATTITPALLRHAAELLTKCAEEHEGCAVHTGAVHGKEAEELRSGIERIMAQKAANPHKWAVAVYDDLRKLLDDVDARDSLAYLETKKTEPAGPWRCGDCGATASSEDRCITCAGRA